MFMKCEKCEEKAITTQPNLCSKHFDEYVLETVKETIERFSLFTKKDDVGVAVSGGKDSLALLDILTRLGYSIKGLFIDEGIENYREHSEKDLDEFIEQKKIVVKKYSFKREAGFTLDEAVKTKGSHPCTVCGTLRRYILNKQGKEFDVLATGHNLDDEAQTILINLARGNTDLLFRSGPSTKEQELFVRKVKPLFFLKEKHILTYVVLRGIKVDFAECPYAPISYRAAIRDLLNKEEEKNPGTKRNMVETYLSMKKGELPPSAIGKCEKCGEASKEKMCKACKLIKEIKNNS